MAGLIDRVPAEARWQIATQGLTGAYTAVANALKEAIGEEKYNEFNGAVWFQAGKAAKEFADTFGLKVDTPKDVAELLALLAETSMGPEADFEVVEATETRCVGRFTKCPWHERWKELGLGWDYCASGHRKWGDGAVESVKPDLSHRVTKSMLHGEPFCEIVVERKK